MSVSFVFYTLTSSRTSLAFRTSSSFAVSESCSADTCWFGRRTSRQHTAGGQEIRPRTMSCLRSCTAPPSRVAVSVTILPDSSSMRLCIHVVMRGLRRQVRSDETFTYRVLDVPILCVVRNELVKLDLLLLFFFEVRLVLLEEPVPIQSASRGERPVEHDAGSDRCTRRRWVSF